MTGGPAKLRRPLARHVAFSAGGAGMHPRRAVRRPLDKEAGAPRPTVELDGGLRISWKWQVSRPRAGEVSTEVTDPVADPVGDPVARLLRLLRTGPLAPSQLQLALGLKHRPTFKENYLRPALAGGLIEMTIPETPSSRLQKYSLTSAGKARLEATSKAKP